MSKFNAFHSTLKRLSTVLQRWHKTYQINKVNRKAKVNAAAGSHNRPQCVLHSYHFITTAYIQQYSSPKSVMPCSMWHPFQAVCLQGKTVTYKHECRFQLPAVRTFYWLLCPHEIQIVSCQLSVSAIRRRGNRDCMTQTG